MTAVITDFFRTIFGDNVILATILIAIVPLIELKGAIPFAMSAEFWGEYALSAWQAFGFAFFGSILVVPVIALVFRPLYRWLMTKKFFAAIMDFLVGGVAKKTATIQNDVSTQTTTKGLWLKILAVVVFVAFPVPLTGVWTGTCFAVLLGLNFWQTCGTVIFGNVICGLIVTFLCSIFPGITKILLFIFLGLIIVALVTKIILHLARRKKTPEVNHGND